MNRINIPVFTLVSEKDKGGQQFCARSIRCILQILNLAEMLVGTAREIFC
jgi:hypothetical protein